MVLREGRPSGDPGIRLHGEHLGRGDVSQYGALHGGQASEILYRPGGRLRLRAKRSKAYVIYMNGTVSRVKSLRKARIEPGCGIVIPSKRERKGMSLPAITEHATSAASIGTMAASIAIPVEISGKDDGRDGQSDRPCEVMVRSTGGAGAQAVGRTPEDRQMVRRGGVGGTRHRLQHPKGTRLR